MMNFDDFIVRFLQLNVFITSFFITFINILNFPLGLCVVVLVLAVLGSINIIRL